MTTPPSDHDSAVIERLDSGEPPSSPEEAQARAPYEHLFERLRDLDDISPPAGWEDRAVERWRAARRRRWQGFALGATASVGLAAVILLRPCSERTQAPQPALEIAVLTAPGAPHRADRGDHMVGNVLRVRARVDRAHVEVRLYHDTKLVARCPGSSHCQIEGPVIELNWQFTEPGRYETVAFSSPQVIPPPSDRGIELDQLEARNAGATIESHVIPITQ